MILWCLLVSPLGAAIYKWTDNKGTVHFSDMPHKGAEKFILPDEQSHSFPAVKEKNGLAMKVESVSEYEISIIQPADQSTIRNNQGQLTVIVQIKPRLKAGDTLQLFYDDKPVAESDQTMVFTLSEIERGSHHLIAKIIDKNGKTISTSKKIIFFMHRPRVRFH
nr:DUF4124 domain-containing protein [Legionella sp. PL877]